MNILYLYFLVMLLLDGLPQLDSCFPYSIDCIQYNSVIGDDGNGVSSPEFADRLYRPHSRRRHRLRNMNSHIYSISTYQRGDILRLNTIMEKHFARNDTLNENEWQRGLPGPIERRQMRKLIGLLYRTSSFDDMSRHVDAFLRRVPVLARSISLTMIGNCYCVIHESLPNALFTSRPFYQNVDDWEALLLSTNSNNWKFPRNWGYTVIASKECVHRPQLHHSSPHFQSDGDVGDEAATLFERTRSRTLVVAGASRYSVRGNVHTTCITSQSLADAAHNNETMFQAMNLGVYEAVSTERRQRRARPIATGAPRRWGTNKPVFIQWHGMSNTTCPSTQIFISAGARSTNFIYTDPNTPANKLASAVNRIKRVSVAKTPVTSPSCILQATTNIFGRFLNGVGQNEVCRTKSKSQDISGQFVHVEQQEWARGDWQMWIRALKMAFSAQSINRRHN